MKKIVFLLCAMLILLSSCGPSETSESPNSQSENTMQPSTDQNSTPSFEVESTITGGSDVEIGLKNIKIDTNGASLTDGQKKVIQYFDSDYITISNYEFLRRYPNIFIGTQMKDWGCIYKVIQQDNDSYEALMGWGYSDNACGNSDEYGNWLSGWDYYKDKLVLLRGVTGDTWLIDNDFVYLEGRYTGIETVSVDGVSYTIPVFDVHNCNVWSGIEGESYGMDRFTYNDIKEIARTIFGENIRISESNESEILSIFVDFPSYPVYTVTLENQSNANFSRYLLTSVGGQIYDISTRSSWDDPIQRYLEFSPDFKHYFLYTYDISLENLELAYYDTSFNKLWSREFVNTTNAVYDYTQSNLYLIANNSLYIIDLQTGEDVISPKYVGEKLDVRKVSDGILLLAQTKSDGLMKCNLSGEIEWTVNLPHDLVYPTADVQFVDSNLVLGYTYESDDVNEYGWADYITIYCLYDLNTGDLIQSGETVSS